MARELLLQKCMTAVAASNDPAQKPGAPLAFSSMGTRFQPPKWAAYWLVRRMSTSGRGTPEAVWDEDGLPLRIPLTADVAELRDAVGGKPGRYRLDPLDEEMSTPSIEDDGRKRSRRGQSGGVVTVPYAYVMVRGRNGQLDASAPSDFRDSLILDLVKQNQDNCERMTAQFAGVMEAAATLVRAADGAGIPQREPREYPQLAEAMSLAMRSIDDGDEDEGANSAALVQVLTNLTEQVTPLLSHAVHTRVMGLSAEQSLALMGKPALAGAGAKTSEAPKVAAVPATADPVLAKLATVETLLNAAEATFARQVIQGMSPADLAAWREQVLSQSPEQLAQLVRERMRQGAAA